ncbi:hypothetical protein SCUP234_10857 [Seiridium cupressi]
MPQRTDYTTQTIFSRPAPAAVTYDLSIPNQATITLPPKSTWTSGPHWHETHTEFLRVLSGAAEITLSGAVLPSVTRDDGIVTVPRGAVHEWRRSRAANGEEDLVVREWTHPGDGAKEVFFRNLNGMVLDFVKQQEAASKDEQQMAWLTILTRRPGHHHNNTNWRASTRHSANMGKWDDKSDRDLIFAILLTVKGDGPLKVSWELIKQQMDSWGHDFSKDAMNQRWSKTIFKEFKNSKNGETGTAQADKAAKVTVARKRKAPKAKTAASHPSTSAEADDEESAPVVSKKIKTAGKLATANLSDQDDEFENDEH